MSARPLPRRDFLRRATTAAGLAALGPRARAAEPKAEPARTKLSVASYSYRDLLTAKANPMTLEGFLAKAAELKLDAVEPTSYYFKDPSAAYLRQFRERARQLGLAISGTSVGNDFAHPPGPERAKQLQHVKTWVDHAEALGAPVIRIFAGHPKKGQSPDDAHQLIVAAIEECCDYAGQHGVRLALENHGGPTATVQGLLKIVNDVKSTHFGVNLDTGNFQSADPYADMALAAPRAINVHVKAELRVGGKTEPADYKRVIRLLREAGYDRYVVLEYEAKEDPLTAIPRHIQALRDAIAAA
jgi:sugar phosphate isomerase/epimerase